MSNDLTRIFVTIHKNGDVQLFWDEQEAHHFARQNPGWKAVVNGQGHPRAHIPAHWDKKSQSLEL